MISDVLSEAVDSMDRYLNDPVFKNVYDGELRKELLSLRNKMDSIRARLDMVPPETPCPLTLN